MAIEVLLNVPITFETPDGTTHAPMVDALVGGKATKLILDTGSSDHILTRELADAAGLPYESAEPGTDSIGASVPSWRIGGLAIELGGMEVALDGVLAINGPAPFAAWGIGGFLSPQHLHATASAVLDLATTHSSLTLVEGSDADLSRWLGVSHPGLRPILLPRETGGGELLVRSAIEPYEPVVTLLDTGGKRTEFAAAAVPALQTGRRTRTGRGVGGADTSGLEVGGQTLRVGDISLPIPNLLVREETGAAPGLVGMDVLRQTVIAVAADAGRPATWMIPDR